MYKTHLIPEKEGSFIFVCFSQPENKNHRGLYFGVLWSETKVNGIYSHKFMVVGKWKDL